MDSQRYQDTLERCSVLKDLELLPHGDQTVTGERGINLSGGQKQRIQLARALDAETATTIFKEYVMGALSRKAVLLVTHQVDFLPACNSILLMSEGEIAGAATYHQLLATSLEFQELVNAHKETASSCRLMDITAPKRNGLSNRKIESTYIEERHKGSLGDQLIKHEEKEVGERGFKPYIQYMNQNNGYLYFTLAVFGHFTFITGTLGWLQLASVNNANVSRSRLIVVYLIIGCATTLSFLRRSIFTAVLGLQSAKSLFIQLLNSLFHAPVSVYDSITLG